MRKIGLAAGVAAFALMTEPVLSTPAMAQQVKAARTYDIAAGPLGQALNQLGRTAGKAISYDPGAVQGKTTDGVRGARNVDQALRTLLHGTGLQARADGTGGFIIAKLLTRAPMQRGEAPRRSISIARPAAAQTQGDDTVVVTGSAYRDNVATGGARIAAQIRDLPISITSLSEKLVQDRQIRNLRQLADNVAGVQSRASGAGNFSLDFTVRGLQFAGIAYNGFRTDGSIGRDQQNVERVEFLKGPASVLYGASGALSGLINVVTKTPKKDAFVTVEGFGGQDGYARATIDANAPLTDTLQVRVNGSTQIANSLNTFTDISSVMVAPSVAWSPLSGVKFLAEYSYFKGSQPPRLANGRTNYPRLLDLPLRFKIGDYGAYNNSRANTYHGEASWEVTPSLTLRQGIYRNLAQEDTLDIPGYTKELASDGHTLLRSQDSTFNDSADFSSQTEVRWTVNLGPTRHKILVGFEYANNRYGYASDQSQPFPSLDLDNPVYGYPVRPRILDYEGGGITRANAPYIQDFIEIGSHWKLLGGLRYDRTIAISRECRFRGCTKSKDPTVSGRNSLKVNAVTPRVGITWEPGERTAVYTSWAKSFVPNAITDKNGDILPPERGTQYEIGVRQDLISDHRLILTLSAYDLRRQNIIEEDPFNLGSYIAVGEHHVQGVEAELAGKPVEWIDVIGAYSYIHGIVSKSETATTGIPEGTQLPEAPHHSASMFTKVTLVPLDLPDTSLGLGVYYQGVRPTRDSFYPADPSFTRYRATTRFDLAFYQVVSRRFQFQANITNVFGTRIFEPVNQGSFRNYPFSVTGGFRVTL